MRQRCARLLAWDDDWRRPLPAHWLRADLLWAVAFLLLAALGLEAARSMGLLAQVNEPVWVQYAALVGTAALVTWRRRLPLLTLVAVATAMFVTGITMPQVMALVIPQVLYLFAFYSAMAWGTTRRRTVLVTAATVLFMLGWVGWQFIYGDELKQAASTPRQGLLDADTATVIYTLVINLIFFGGAVVSGQVSWRAARQHAELVALAGTIGRQAEQLHQQSLLDERLRIARELHDVVAHHVAVMGVQAGAARKTLERDPQVAAGALHQVEQSARQAVGEMRALLGTLRTDGADRDPQPSTDDIARLIDRVRESGLAVTYDVVEECPGLLGTVPPSVGLSLYRTVQEALSNVRKHSTADSARVVLRALREADASYAEVEVIDAGRPRGETTTGSGLGLVGMRERMNAHGGTGEIGPRATGGYRVRVRLPLEVG